AGPGMAYRDDATFSVSMSLSEAGVAHIDEISSLLFQYIRLVKREGIQEWLFEEQRRMAGISFMFQEPSRPISYVSSLSRRLQEYPAAEVLSAPYAYEEFDPDLLRDYLGYLRPDNLLLTFTSRTVETDRGDPLLGGQYALRPLRETRLGSWREDAIDPALAIPAPSPFLPEDLSLKP